MLILAPLLLLGGLALGEVQTGATPSQPLELDGADAALVELLRWYETDETRAGAPFAWRLEPMYACPQYTRLALSFPSPLVGAIEENNTVYGKYWVPSDRSAPGPAVIVLHWKGGSLDLIDLIGGHLAMKGVAALALYLPHYGPRRSSDPAKRTRMVVPDYEAVLANHRQAVLDVRRAIDWLSSRPEVAPGRVGLFGISLGAVVGSLAAGVDGRFERCVLLLGGGDIAGIVMNPSRETRSVREAAQAANLTVDDLRALWRPAEPLTFAARIRPEGALMINCVDDEVIPAACARKLQEAMGLPAIHWYPGGHHALVIRALEILGVAVDHLAAGAPPRG